jgi:photosystem II stability/assembly factor-like uncharacterized protein
VPRRINGEAKENPMKPLVTLTAAVATAAALALVPFASAATSAMAPKASWYWTMAVAPSSPNVLVLGTSGGLFRSSNGGKSWRHVGPGDFNATSVTDTGSTVLAAGVKQAPTALPTVTKHGDYAVAPGPGLFVASHDGGLTWHALVPSGLPAVDVQALAVDPANTSTVVAVLANGAVYRSSDGAASFTQLARKVGGPPWAVTVTAGGGLAAGNMTTGSYVSADG